MAVKSYTDFTKRINEEEEGGMYLQKIQEISTFAQQIREMINEEDDLEAWIQDKITIAHHNMDAILGYMKSEKGEGASAAAGETTSMNLLNT